MTIEVGLLVFLAIAVGGVVFVVATIARGMWVFANWVRRALVEAFQPVRRAPRPVEAAWPPVPPAAPIGGPPSSTAGVICARTTCGHVNPPGSRFCGRCGMHLQP